MLNKLFYSTLVRVCLTIIAFTVTFYGIFIVYIVQQTQAYREEIATNLQQDNIAVRSFAYITDAVRDPFFNVSIQLRQQKNARAISQQETWKDSPVEIFNSTVTWIVNNYTQALERDEEVRDWLKSHNRTRFLANYNEAIFSLNGLIYMMYQEVPPPPGEYTSFHVQTFVSSDFPSCSKAFLSWAERYSLFYSGVLEIRSRISSALQGISEAYLDSAKSCSQRLEELLQENRTDDWHMISVQNWMEYYIAESEYHMSAFHALSNINSSVNITVINIERYNLFYGLAFSNIFIPIIGMAVCGVATPMIIIGLGQNIDKRGRDWCLGRRVLTGLCIIWFILFLHWSISIFWEIIMELHFV